MTHSESTKELAAALAKAQGAMGVLLKSSDNPYFKSRYADLAAVWDACRKALSDNGLSVVQAPVFDADHADWVCLDTTLLHASGEWMTSRCATKPVKVDPQGMGSAWTYLRRYSLQALVGLAADDDDGNAASGKDPKVPAVAAKVAEAAAKASRKPPTEPMPDPTPMSERGFPGDPGAQPHGDDGAVYRAAFMGRARKVGLSEAEAGALAKIATGKGTSKAFTPADWDRALGQIDMRERFMGWVNLLGADPDERKGWLAQNGFTWTLAWNAAAFSEFYGKHCREG